MSAKRIEYQLRFGHLPPILLVLRRCQILQRPSPMIGTNVSIQAPRYGSAHKVWAYMLPSPCTLENSTIALSFSSRAASSLGCPSVITWWIMRHTTPACHQLRPSGVDRLTSGVMTLSRSPTETDFWPVEISWLTFLWASLNATASLRELLV